MNDFETHAPVDLHANRDHVLHIVQKNGLELEFASDELRADRELVMCAVKNYGNALKFASLDLRADRAVVLEAVKSYGGSLQFASEELRADFEVALETVTRSGWALEFVASQYCADRTIVLAAVHNYGEALKFATRDLRADREVVIEAMRQNWRAVDHALVNLHTSQLKYAFHSKIAIQGCKAVVCTVTSLEKNIDGAVVYKVLAGLGGEELEGILKRPPCNIGDLAYDISSKVGGGLIYLVMPGATGPVSPLMAIEDVLMLQAAPQKRPPQKKRLYNKKIVRTCCVEEGCD